jgi:hypothetical protein
MYCCIRGYAKDSFHRIVKVCRTIIFDKYVIMPTNAEEAKGHMYEFKMVGFP